MFCCSSRTTPPITTPIKRTTVPPTFCSRTGFTYTENSASELIAVQLFNSFIAVIRNVEIEITDIEVHFQFLFLWMRACAAPGLGRIIEVEGKPYDPRYAGLILHDFRRSTIRNLINAGVPERVP